MEDKLSNDSSLLQQVEQYKMSSAALMKEGWKVQNVLEMMNACSDHCNLRYYESGMKDASQPGVECFSECITEHHSAKMSADKL